MSGFTGKEEYVHAVAVPVNDVHVVGVQPSAPSVSIPQSNTGNVQGFQNEGGAREFLSMQGFPQGLQDTFVESLRKIPLRFFIVDDSGSMSSNDGKRIVVSGGKKAMIKCSRWVELAEALKFHVEFAKQACAPTEFRLLNGAPPIKVGMMDADDSSRVSMLKAMLDGSPSGGTPLCRHIRDVITQIRAAEQELRANGQKACLIIATDGESSDGNIAEAMAPLKDLPVWVVVRLCTDEDNIVNYWNNIDEQLELSMDVLDDLSGEAAEVYTQNPWLTYGEPLQRLREFGIAIKELDLLDEAKLSLDQIRVAAKVIYGGQLEDYPHPEVDIDGFIRYIDKKNASTTAVWDPLQKKDRAWIDTRKLASLFKPGCSIS